MKKLISIIVMLIFILPFSIADAGGKNNNRQRQNERQYNHGRPYTYEHRYGHNMHNRRYVYKGHYNRNKWERHHRQNRHIYEHGFYYNDRNDNLMFSYCQRERNGEVCFSFSIGD